MGTHYMPRVGFSLLIWESMVPPPPPHSGVWPQGGLGPRHQPFRVQS